MFVNSLMSRLQNDKRALSQMLMKEPKDLKALTANRKLIDTEKELTTILSGMQEEALKEVRKQYDVELEYFIK